MRKITPQFSESKRRIQWEIDSIQVGKKKKKKQFKTSTVNKFKLCLIYHSPCSVLNVSQKCLNSEYLHKMKLSKRFLHGSQ